jgi:hypothetical protein
LFNHTQLNFGDHEGEDLVSRREKRGSGKFSSVKEEVIDREQREEGGLRGSGREGVSHMKGVEKLKGFLERRSKLASLSTLMIMSKKASFRFPPSNHMYAHMHTYMHPMVMHFPILKIFWLK